MRTLYTTQYTGRKATVGVLCFDENNRMCIFVGYCDSCKGKVTMSRNEAEVFAHKYRQITNKRDYRKFVRELEMFTIK